MSKKSLPRLILIDGLTKRDHLYLETTDKCAYVGEYTARAGPCYSRTNQLIYNLKKGLKRREESDWHYKQDAILHAGRIFETVLSQHALVSYTFVPIPPSMVLEDPNYDNRMSEVIRAIRPSNPVGIRELIFQTRSIIPAHCGGRRLKPAEIAALYRIDESLTSPKPATVVVVDDVLTKGAHFKAAQTVLQKRFPDLPVLGLFVARCVLLTEDSTENFQC